MSYHPPRRENYDPAKPVCDNQADFNQAVKEAVKYSQDQYRENHKGAIAAYIVIWLIFLIWAVFLALKRDAASRVSHLMFAMVFSPFYVMAYYLAGTGGSNMRMCGRMHE